jgi:hypothetical protein
MPEGAVKSFIIAQGLAEYGAVASKSAGGGASSSGGLQAVRYRLESYVGEGNLPWLLAAVVAVVFLAFVLRQKWSARG